MNSVRCKIEDITEGGVLRQEGWRVLADRSGTGYWKYGTERIEDAKGKVLATFRFLEKDEIVVDFV